MIDPLYVASGFGVGLLVGMTGVGGGSLMTPVLILLFGVHPSTAVGTDLLYAAATKTGGSLVHGRLFRNLDVRRAAGKQQKPDNGGNRPFQCNNPPTNPKVWTRPLLHTNSG